MITTAPVLGPLLHAVGNKVAKTWLFIPVPWCGPRVGELDVPLGYTTGKMRGEIVQGSLEHLFSRGFSLSKSL